MFSVDGYILEFVSKNWLGISMFMAALKYLSVLTPGTEDDKIYTFLSNILATVNPLKPKRKDHPEK